MAARVGDQALSGPGGGEKGDLAGLGERAREVLAQPTPHPTSLCPCWPSQLDLVSLRTPDLVLWPGQP